MNVTLLWFTVFCDVLAERVWLQTLWNFNYVHGEN